MNALSTVLSLALLAGQTVGHVALMPPQPDKILTPNSTEAPPGCKLLACDKGFPAEDVWRAALPGVFKKYPGTAGPDYIYQPETVEQVQAGVNFARDHNVRLTIITTGHDFHGREDARSGLRLDMSAFQHPTVFAQDWSCGTTLKPRTVSGREVEDVIACAMPTKKRSTGTVPLRGKKYKFFEKRAGHGCAKLMKRHGPGEEDEEPAEAMTGHVDAEEIGAFNIIQADPNKPAYAKVPASMYNEMFFEQADQSGLMTAGAQHNGVSVTGGWMQAGGHNPFVNRIGMQVDNVMEIEVVTADGKFQKVSECNNPELYWALRGGGGSTFGVVTGATVKVHPTFPVVVSRFFVNSTKPEIADAVAYFLQNGAKLRDEYGLQGYFYMYPTGFQSVLHMPAEYATLENAKKATEPLMAKMEEMAGAEHIEPDYYQYKTYRDWYVAEMGNEAAEMSGVKGLSWYDGTDGSVPSMFDAMMNPMVMIPWVIKDPQGPQEKRKRHEQMKAQAMLRTYLDSRLLSDKHVNSVSIETLAKAITDTWPKEPGTDKIIDGANIRGFLYGGGEQAKPDKDAMGLLPAWRDMTYHWIINAVPGDWRHDYDIGPIAELFPDAGAYVNEASVGEPRWKEVFWGEHYPKLEELKKKYDPQNVLWCSPCVGADVFTYDDERICPNPKYPEAGPPPQTYNNEKSTKGIASLPGEPGIPNPLMPIIESYFINSTLPDHMPSFDFFKIPMGNAGSVPMPEEGEEPMHSHAEGGMDIHAEEQMEMEEAEAGHSQATTVATTAAGHSHG